MRARRTFFVLMALTFAAGRGESAEPALRGAWKTLEPVESVRATVVLSSPGRARVREAGERARRIRLRRGERLLAIAEESDGWVVAGAAPRGAVSDLTFARGGKSGISRLPLLPERSPGLRGRPQLLIERGHLAGVAWLEGRGLDDLTVRASDWTGVDWGGAASVSEGRAIRSGLTGAVLSDGSWLLVWSQYDGNDDELYWSLRKGAAWSTPAPVSAGNTHPDITPQLLALDHGAVLAWSRFDGADYRLTTARFRRGRWRLTGYEGPAGSISPRFKRTDQSSLLVFRNAQPAAWTALRLDPAGDVTGIASVPTSIAARPVVASSRAGNPLFDWPLLKHRRQERWEQPVR